MKSEDVPARTMLCPHCEPDHWTGGHDSATLLAAHCDAAIHAEFWKRARAKKAASVAAGGKKGGWPLGRKRKAIPQPAGCSDNPDPRETPPVDGSNGGLA